MIDHGSEERVAAWSLALLSTLSVAVDLVRAMSERRQGRDPSEQQSTDVVLPGLRDELRSLENRIVALRSNLVAAEAESIGRIALVRRMNDLIVLGRIARGLHRIHQRLMSLYPRVDERIVEDARRLHRACDGLCECESLTAEQIVAFMEEAATFLAEIRESVAQN